MSNTTTDLSIDTYRTIGKLDDPQPAKWVSVVYDADGQTVASSGLQATKQESIDAVTALLAAA